MQRHWKIEDTRYQESVHAVHLTTLHPRVQDEGLMCDQQKREPSNDRIQDGQLWCHSPGRLICQDQVEGSSIQEAAGLHIALASKAQQFQHIATRPQ
eukprot:Skav210308  [mRNA]  locus=scaffold475:225713:227348:+ [translate_table: standard]